MIRVEVNGDFRKANSALEKMLEIVHLGSLDRYGAQGVEALKAATPVDSGKTADSWQYEIKRTKNTTELDFNNDNINDGVNVAVLLQYGHGTGTGGYVPGRDYINPAIQPVMDNISNSVDKELTLV